MKHRKQRRVNDKTRDIHHIFWSRKDWHDGCANLIRDHWYCKVSIPKNTLHKEIHNNVTHVPVPPIGELKRAFSHLAEMEQYGIIKKNDDIERRLVMLIPLFEGTTKQALQHQFNVVSDFYYPRKE